MEDMITFCSAMLSAVTAFLASEPIFYLFSLVCFAVIIKITLSLIKLH